MSIIFRLAQRYIARRLFQSILFIIGVALGVAMVIAIDLANQSASRAFSLSRESITGRATHQIVGGPAGLSTEIYDQLSTTVDDIASAPILTAQVSAADFGNLPLELIGIEPTVDDPFRDFVNNFTLSDEIDDPQEALRAFLTTSNAVIIGTPLAEQLEVQPGDTLMLNIGIERVVVNIIGLLRPNDRVGEQALNNLIVTDLLTAQSLTGREGRITRIDLIVPKDADLSPIESLLPTGARIINVADANTTLTQLTAAFELNLQALSLLALVVGVFLIYNTVTFSVVQRRPVIGILRSLGTTRSQIFTLILGEAFILGVLGTLLGVGLGIVLGRGAVRLVTQTVNDLYFTVNVRQVVIPPLTLIKGAMIGVTASLIAALIPSLDATRTPPAGVMRRSDVEQSIASRIPLLTFFAVVTNALGAVILRLSNTSVVLSFVGLFLLIIGMTMLTPLVMTGFMRGITPVTTALFGVLGRMAPRAVVRSLSRTSVAVAALTIAVSVIVGVSVMIGSFRNTVADWLETNLGADIYISPPDSTVDTLVDIDPTIVDELLVVEGVADAATVRSVKVFAPDYPELPPVNLAAIDSIISRRERRFVWNNAPNGDYWQAMQAGSIIVSEAFAFRRGITQENNTLTLLTDAGEETFTVAGVYYDYSSDQGIVLIADDVYRTYYDDSFISSMALFVEDEAMLDPVMRQLRTKTLAGKNLEAQSYFDLRAGVFEIFDRAFAITVALRLLATVVAFIGILSALMALQLEQTRQYGVMRAIGLTSRQLWRLTLIQTGLMGIVSGLMALPIGFVMALVLIFVINVRSFGWTMQLTILPGEFAQAFAVAVVAALIAGIYPAWRLSKLVTARALRHE